MLTIGIPVYNNEKTLRKTVESVLNSVGLPCEIILSDDCSSDRSWNICQELVGEFDSVTAYQQPKNLYYNNFKFVLEKAKTPYFCWLAGDDYFEPEFLDNAIEYLKSHQDCVAAIGDAAFYNDSGFIGYSNGAESIEHEDASERLESYFSKTTDNNRMYGVYRTSVAINSFPKKLYHAWDYAFSANSLIYGKHHKIETICNHRHKTSTESYRQLMRRDGKNVVTRLFPLLPLTCDLTVSNKIYFKRKLIFKLLEMNFNCHLNYCEYFHPGYHRKILSLMNFWVSKISWRFK